jgi:ribosomal protein S18 acetylase RimI-like enzyme
MAHEIRTMTIEDYDQVVALWRHTEGLSISDDDSRERLALYLARNHGLSFVALRNRGVIGAVLCGHDGRRGILRHLAVSESCRGCGIAKQLVERAVHALGQEQIHRCNLYVLDSNPAALSFWEHMGWYHLEDNYRTLQTMVQKDA